MGWTIGELARKAGVWTSTLRFYVRRGLTAAPPRKSGRRDYGDQDLRRLKRILAARAAGISVAEIGALAATQDGEEARGAVRRRLAEIDAEIARLASARKTLAGALACPCVTLRKCRAFD